MQSAEFERFRDLMRGMGRVFGSEPDALVLDIYWLALRDWTLPEFESATALLMASAQFMPRPADYAQMRRAAEPTAAEAWAKVLAKVRTMSRYELVKIDPRIDAVVAQLGGYGTLMSMTTDQTPWIAKRFSELWSDAATAESARALAQDGRSPLRLVGGTDSEAAR